LFGQGKAIVATMGNMSLFSSSQIGFGPDYRMRLALAWFVVLTAFGLALEWRAQWLFDAGGYTELAPRSTAQNLIE
jgi:hypothetical protein